MSPISLFFTTFRFQLLFILGRTHPFDVHRQKPNLLLHIILTFSETSSFPHTTISAFLRRPNVSPSRQVNLLGFRYLRFDNPSFCQSSNSPIHSLLQNFLFRNYTKCFPSRNKRTISQINLPSQISFINSNFKQVSLLFDFNSPPDFGLSHCHPLHSSTCQLSNFHPLTDPGLAPI
jgi:hypothetical protein